MTTIDVQITEQQRMALAWRGFDEPVVEDIGLTKGNTFRAWTIRDDMQFAEHLGRTPEVAVQQLVNLVARP